MAEKIKTGDTFQKEVYVSTINSDGEEEPVNLDIFDDNYFVVKNGRDQLDEDAYVFKKAIIKGDPADGILAINLTPQETSMLPLTGDDIPYLEGYVQIGSTITGEVHEVATFKIKTILSGVRYITPVDTSYDMGCIKETVGYVFDAGNICEPVNMVIELDEANMGRIVYNGGALSDTVLDIYDPGYIISIDINTIDLGQLRECLSDPATC